MSSGSKIVHPNDDAGGLAVSMKLESAVVRLKGAEKNIQNGISFLEVQDGVLSNAGKIMSRMIELKGLSQDVLKTVLIMIITTESLETYRFSYTKCQTLLLMGLACLPIETAKILRTQYLMI